MNQKKINEIEKLDNMTINDIYHGHDEFSYKLRDKVNELVDRVNQLHNMIWKQSRLSDESCPHYVQIGTGKPGIMMCQACGKEL